MKAEGIYYIRNHTTKQIYIGSAVDIKRRLGQHQRALAANSHENRILRRWASTDKLTFEVAHSYPAGLTNRRYLLTLEASYIAGHYEGWQKVNLSKPLNLADTLSADILATHLLTGYPIYQLSHDSLEISYQMPPKLSPHIFLCRPAVEAFMRQNRGYLHLLSTLINP